MNAYRRSPALRIFVKALALFAVLNLVSLVIDPVPPLARLSIYNGLVPGRERLPWGERPDLAYSLSLDNLDAMFAAHKISVPKTDDEFRVVLIGDSSTWGFLLRPEETLARGIEARGIENGGKRVRVYNLGYPDFSITKDALLLNRALAYQPDLIVWLVTLRSFPIDAQHHALTLANPTEAYRVQGGTSPASPASPLARSIVARRREIADLLRLQVFGLAWAATGIDQHYPAQYDPAQRDLDPDTSFSGATPPLLPEAMLAYEVMSRTIQAAGSAHVVLVNEPILISRGANSDVRYNAFYPRWAYDAYREQLRRRAAGWGVRYLDLWDAVPEGEFTNSAVHLTAKGSDLIAAQLAPLLGTPPTR